MNNVALLDNIILLTDSYKLSHYKQYPKDAEIVFSYFESRVGAKFDHTVFFSLQYILKKYIEGIVVTQDKIEQAASVARLHMLTGSGDGTFNRAGWELMLEKHGGILPVRIRAVPEGTKVPTGNVMLTIENTDPDFPWLPNYLETLLVQVWYGSTVATISSHVRSIVKTGMEQTGADMAGLPFKLHDFGVRGSTTMESAAVGGMAHLAAGFQGTDNLPALLHCIQYYGAGMPGHSIAASEHSTITSWGAENELEAVRNMLEEYPEGPVACVGDSYNIDRHCSTILGKELKELIMKRDGVWVARPDSGEIVPMVNNVLGRLYQSFGGETNDKGCIVLDPHVRAIQGDGCTLETIKEVVDMMIDNRWSLDNIAFGMGGGLLQKLDRDTQRFAFKASAIRRNGEWQDVFKQPKSDPTKNSKKGRIELYKSTHKNSFYTHEDRGELPYFEKVMRTVFEDGEILITDDIETIRKRAEC
tara:strand:+ start:114481 stop:115899 length:1419 start_codon:yes stop_codon:yes gene_type:complete